MRCQSHGPRSGDLSIERRVPNAWRRSGHLMDCSTLLRHRWPLRGLGIPIAAFYREDTATRLAGLFTHSGTGCVCGSPGCSRACRPQHRGPTSDEVSMREILVALSSGSLAVWLAGHACYINARFEQRSRGEMTGETFWRISSLCQSTFTGSTESRKSCSQGEFHECFPQHGTAIPGQGS